MTYEIIRRSWRQTTESDITALVPVYVGPGDIVAGASNWWGLRSYSSDKLNYRTVRLRRSSDNQEQDFYTTASGILNLSAITAFAGGSNLFASVLYDQAGNANLTQTTQSQQPQFISNNLSGTPSLRFTDAAASAMTVSSIVATQPFTVSWVANRTSPGVFNATFLSANIVASGFAPTEGFLYHLAPSETDIGTGTPVGTYHAVQNVFNGASSDLNIDGVSNITNPGTNNMSGRFDWSDDQFNNHMEGNAMEIGVWDIAFTSVQSFLMAQNQMTYWAF